MSAIRLLLLGITTVSAFTAWIGLVCFWRPAREIYLFAAACAVVLALFSGPQVSTPVAAAFSVLNGLASGAILGLVYFSDLARRFERNPVAHPPAGMSFGAHRG